MRLPKIFMDSCKSIINIIIRIHFAMGLSDNARCNAQRTLIYVKRRRF